MKPAAFDYVRAESLDEALSVLADAGEDARILAGGQSLGPMLNLRLAQPAVLIDIGHIPDFDRIEWTEDGVIVMAGARQAALLADEALAARQPLLHAGMPWIGHVQTRARGTVCGSLAHADPAAELPLLLSVLGGVALVRSASGQRGIQAADFYAGMFQTDIRPDELLFAARFNALPEGAGVAFREVAERHGDFAIVAAAAVADAGGVSLGLGGVGDTPLVYRWDGLTLDLARDAVWELADRLDPRSDPRADGAYRRRLVKTVGLAVVKHALEARHAI